MIGGYEMTVIPRTNFAPDGTPLLTADKASLMTQIIVYAPVQRTMASPKDKTQVLIVDGMPEVKCLKKKPTTTKMQHLKHDFNVRIKNKAYITFDEYNNGEFLKAKTWAKRCTSSMPEEVENNEDDSEGGFDFHDDMCLKKTSVAKLIETNKLKRPVTAYLAEGL